MDSNCHEAIVTDEEFQKTQDSIRKYSGNGIYAPIDYPLRSLVTCGICGRAMMRHPQGKRKYYICSRSVSDSSTECPVKEKFCETDIETAVISDLREKLRLFADNQRRIADAQKQTHGTEANIRVCISRIERQKFLRPFLGAKEYLHNQKRWCLWLKDVYPSELKSMPAIMHRISMVRKFRENSTKAATRKYAQYPYLFMEIRQPENKYIIIPSHSSENRKYIPIGFLDPVYICGNANLLVESAEIYHFGVLTSNVHMAWMRAVCGRLEMRYRYSNTIVYNNFPWCNPTDAQRAKIERTARSILDARALYPDSSLADLYDELTMSPELRKAHQQNDRAVMETYGFDVKTTTESSCVAELMKMYRELTENLNPKQ